GIFDGGEGYLINSGSGSLNSSVDIRVGDAFGGASAHGEFYHQSSGTINASGYLVVGNAGGTGKIVQTGTGNVHANSLYDGSYGGTGTYTQQNSDLTMDEYLLVGYAGTGIYTQQSGDVAVGFDGNDYMVTVPELYIGHAGNGTYTLSGGSATIYGWTNIGRDSGTGV